MSDVLENIYYDARASGRIDPTGGGRVTVVIKMDIKGYECRAIIGSPGKIERLTIIAFLFFLKKQPRLRDSCLLVPPCNLWPNC